MDKKEMKQTMDTLMGAYPFSVTKISDDVAMSMIEVWFKYLGQYEYDVVEKAMDNIIKKSNWFPSISDFIKEIEEPKGRTGIRDYNDPIEVLQREEMTKAVKRKQEWEKRNGKPEQLQEW
jgi:hypothetical protein